MLLSYSVESYFFITSKLLKYFFQRNLEIVVFTSEPKVKFDMDVNIILPDRALKIRKHNFQLASKKQQLSNFLT